MTKRELKLFHRGFLLGAFLGTVACLFGFSLAFYFGL